MSISPHGMPSKKALAAGSHTVGDETFVSRAIPKISFTIAEACRVTGLGRTFIFGAIRDGRLPAVKAGARTLLPEEGVRLFIASLPVVQPKVNPGNEKPANRR